MTTPDLRSLLERIRGVRHACDLDLLLFFYRHPRALLTAEQIVAWLGHDRERVAKSLEGLIDAGLLSRSQNPSHAARLYLLEMEAIPGGALAPFLKIAATREGRMKIIELLRAGSGRAPVARLTRRARLTKVA
jgi:hypothetical protein